LEKTYLLKSVGIAEC
jgi:hypothetical protein